MRFSIPLIACLAVIFAGCANTPAPVEERDTRSAAERLTADGRYIVRRGDTLHGIAFEFGVDWRDIAAWNGIRAPYLIYPDQELRLSPPAVVTRPAVERTAQSAPRTPQRPSAGAETTFGRVPDTASTGASRPPGPRSAAPVETAPTPPPAGDPREWLWPTEGRIIRSFRANDSARKGIDIGGTEGQPVRATADGVVVYSGSGLIGFGELIIIKHSDSMLSAYAHNRERLVDEGEVVSAGQLIAEMGRNDRNQQLLHFEIRQNGTPQDPLKYLDAR